jgi:hypothetical protein
MSTSLGLQPGLCLRGRDLEPDIALRSGELRRRVDPVSDLNDQRVLALEQRALGEDNIARERCPMLVDVGPGFYR